MPIKTTVTTYKYKPLELAKALKLEGRIIKVFGQLPTRGDPNSPDYNRVIDILLTVELEKNDDGI